MKEDEKQTPFYVTVRGQEYKLCLKTEGTQKTYFFVLSNAPTPEGSQQVSLPDGYAVINTGLPVLRKK